MAPDPVPLAVAVSQRVYHLLLLAYPRTFRSIYRREMAQVFRVLCQQAVRRGDRGALLRLWLHTIGDLVVSATGERLLVMKEKGIMTARDRIVVSLAGVGALGVGYLNTHTDELLVVVPCMALCTFCLGLAQPRHAWRWGLLVGLAIPISQVIGWLLGLTRPYVFYLSDVPVTTVALIPAILSAYLGAALGWSMGHIRDDADGTPGIQ